MISTADPIPVLKDVLKSALKITVVIQRCKAALTGRIRLAVVPSRFHHQQTSATDWQVSPSSADLD
jgi:hypothetical protein